MNGRTLMFLAELWASGLSLLGSGLAMAADSIIVGVSGPAVNLVYAFIARDAGFWQKYGVDAKVVVFESGSILAQAARSGEVKMSITAGPATIASRTQGADTIIIAASVNTLPYSL